MVVDICVSFNEREEERKNMVCHVIVIFNGSISFVACEIAGIAEILSFSKRIFLFELFYCCAQRR